MTAAKSFTFAQFTDVHLSGMPSFSLRYWNLKRFLGFLNWHRGRKKIHQTDIVERLLLDLESQPQLTDHIVITGDLVNIGLPEEYTLARQWLDRVGGPRGVTVIPGNHDIYVDMPVTDGIGKWLDYMQPSSPSSPVSAPAFPFVRTFGDVTFVCCNSAVPTPPFVAAGRLGERQRDRLRTVLEDLRQQGKVRVVLIHHPPLPGLAPSHRGLKDAGALQHVLEEAGAELVIYGHNHRNQLSEIQDRRTGCKIPVVGLASSSAGKAHRSEDLASYHVFKVTVETDQVKIEMGRRGLAGGGLLVAEPDGLVEELDRRTFYLPRNCRPVSALEGSNP